MDIQEFAAEINRKPRQRVIEYRDSFERFIGRADVRSLVIHELKGCLADYKRPRQVEIVGELPRNPTGKVLKRELRARLGG